MFESKEKSEKPKKEEIKTSSKGMVAKRDFVLCHNEYYRKIQKGDDLSDVPKMYRDNLKTEGII